MSRARIKFVAFAALFAAAAGTATGANTPVPKYTDGSREQWIERRLEGRDDTVPGEASAPFPTLVNLSLEWKIGGDDNLNGSVSVAYHRAGERDWRDALPLRRVPGGVFESRDGRPYTARWDNMHAGSILDLAPDTEYEIALRLRDPDGGAAERTLRARTRPVPADMPGARIRKVTPRTLRDEAERAAPGDVFLLAPGNYGFFRPARDGRPGQPVVFRADPHDFRERDLPPGDRNGHRAFVLFDGVSLTDRQWVHLEGVLSTDTIDLFNAEHCVVRRCLVHAVWGIVSGWTPSFDQFGPQPSRLRRPSGGGRENAPPTLCRNCYIADNIVTGVTPWLPGGTGARGKNLGEGIQISGPGNVVCHNRVVGFRDCISLMEGSLAVQQSSIDIYQNDIAEGLDDAIEADYSFSNVRIVRNRIVNCYRGVALAPVLGGPAYVVRNVLYNTSGVWQFGRAGLGYVALHNTSVKSGAALRFESHAHAYARNNLFLGDTASGPLVSSERTPMPAVDYDYDGFGGAAGTIHGNLAGVEFHGAGPLRALTMERHGVQVGLDVFRYPVRQPASLFSAPAVPDLSLRPASAAVDAGLALPNVNDGFAGRAPDLGAYEIGAAAPVYGPRPDGSN